MQLHVGLGGPRAAAGDAGHLEIEPLEPRGARVVLVHEGWSEAGADEALRDDHEGYWSGYLDDLAAILAEG